MVVSEKDESNDESFPSTWHTQTTGLEIPVVGRRFDYSK